MDSLIEETSYGKGGFRPLVAVPVDRPQLTPAYQPPELEFGWVPIQHFGLTTRGIADQATETVFVISDQLSPKLRQRIIELAGLRPNWDGEGAKPVKLSALVNAVGLLSYLSQRSDDFRAPFLVPTFDGFVQIEWHCEKRSLDFEHVMSGWCVVGTMVGSDGTRHYYTQDCRSGDYARLKGYYEWFLGTELLWPLP